TEMTVSFRIMTYNIAAGREADPGELAAVIDSVAPDVVALQEVADNWEEVSRSINQADELARRLDMEAFFAPIYSLESDQGMRHFGLAILTRYPIVRSENHAIARLSTQHEDASPRSMPGFAEAVIQIDGLDVRIFNTHLDYRSDPTVREMQVDDMLSEIGDGNGPIVLLGDLNARPGAPELEALFEGFRDAWQAGDGPGYTMPAGKPDRRIDYILVSSLCKVRTAFVHRSDASDHLPVIADVVCCYDKH
ncbi:MAG: endonuclease/exonuclease/phosphatase family protein, partial [Bacteroidota bacterium]